MVVRGQSIRIHSLFHRVDSGDQAQIVRLGSKLLYRLSRLSDHFFVLIVGLCGLKADILLPQPLERCDNMCATMASRKISTLLHASSLH